MGRLIASVGLVLLASALAVPAQAQPCRRDTLRVELPARPNAGEPTAHVHIRRRGGDPWDGPAGGTCVVQNDVATHVPPGEPRSFRVRADAEALLPFGVAREVLHISMPPGSEITFVSSPCYYFRIEGPDLDVADHHGDRPGTPSEIYMASARPLARTPYGGDCGLHDDTVLSPSAVDCRFTPQLGYCTYVTVSVRGRRHSFWPRSGEHWRVTLDRGDIRTDRAN